MNSRWVKQHCSCICKTWSLSFKLNKLSFLLQLALLLCDDISCLTWVLSDLFELSFSRLFKSDLFMLFFMLLISAFWSNALTKIVWIYAFDVWCLIINVILDFLLSSLVISGWILFVSLSTDVMIWKLRLSSCFHFFFTSKGLALILLC